MKYALKMMAALAVATACATSLAFADCESDMLQLEQALQKPGLSPEAKAALDKATTVSVAAMKKDDDATCHKAIADALAKAGIPMTP